MLTYFSNDFSSVSLQKKKKVPILKSEENTENRKNLPFQRLQKPQKRAKTSKRYREKKKKEAEKTWRIKYIFCGPSRPESCSLLTFSRPSDRLVVWRSLSSTHSLARTAYTCFGAKETKTHFFRLQMFRECVPCACVSHSLSIMQFLGNGGHWGEIGHFCSFWALSVREQPRKYRVDKITTHQCFLWLPSVYFLSETEENHHIFNKY